MPDFAPIIALSSLNGANGFQVTGSGPFAAAGMAVNSAGDVNGDGIEDFIVGGRGFNNSAGAAYVVFGTDQGFPAEIALESLNGTNGFRMHGVDSLDRMGFAATGVGDVNGDGLDDLLVGAYGVGDYVGAAYVVFGRTDGFDSLVDLAALDGTNGFTVGGELVFSFFGRRASAGDINGDGLSDLVVSAAGFAGPSATYVVFGSDQPFAATVPVSSLNGTNGFALTGDYVEMAGRSLSAGGDFNGDGFADILVGSEIIGGNYLGGTYLVLGAASFAASTPVADAQLIVGEAVGDQSSSAVAWAGDFNGDGYDDMLVSAQRSDAAASDAGAAWLIFGNAAGLLPGATLASVDGTNGFQINGVAARDALCAVAGAGDVNGDGYDDLVLGAPEADPNSRYSGSTYVVFGGPGPHAAVLSLASLNGDNGFRLDGEGIDNYSGFSVGLADVNGDGVSDVLVGARAFGADFRGAAYVVFGIPKVFDQTGGADDDSLTGRFGGDTLIGAGGKDILSGMGGDDILDGGDLGDVLYGGDGADDLVGGNGGDVLNGEAGDDLIDGGDGADKLNGGAGADDLVGGLGNDRFDGGLGADVLTGGDGNDYLDGGADGDLMTGGAGNDVYIIDHIGDLVVEAPGGGYDIVRTALGGWVLEGEVEGLELQGLADLDGSGNGGANNLQGNAGANRLDGAGGVDTLNGNDGDDIIVGGLGNDLLRGGLGADTFVVAHAFGPVLETDQVYDFSAAEEDILDLSGAYAGTLSLVAGFTKHAGEMTLTFAGGITTLRLDTTGDGKVDYQMKINGDVTGESGDWLL
ncbi:MAG: hypothetical protein JWR84_4026 [Caulobacter sp.]|nr:hypothetical protein [Caulobacter sp.]